MIRLTLFCSLTIAALATAFLLGRASTQSPTAERQTDATELAERQIDASELQQYANSRCDMMRALQHTVSEMGSPSYATVEAKYAQFAKPSRYHKALNHLVGHWKTAATISDHAGNSKKAVAKSHIRWILGGRFLLEEYEEEQSGFKAMGIYGYDNAKGRFFRIWVDTMGTTYFVSNGHIDKNMKTLTLFSEATELTEGGAVSFRQIYNFAKPNRVIHQNFTRGHLLKNKKEFKAYEIFYTKVVEK